MSQLTPDREILAELSRPFPTSQIKYVPKGGMKLAYITARHAMNRLDEVVGPANWFDQYDTFGETGVKCTLYVRLGGESFVSKCGVGGSAGMQDEDDDEKSAESSSFKRAAVKFGIGRYLYENGVPDFCMGGEPRMQPPGPSTPNNQPAREAPPQRRYSGGGDGGPGRQFDNFKVPPPGKAVFAWAKNIGGHYRVDLIPGMRSAGESINAGGDFTKWSKIDAEEICLRAIAMIKTLENYDGKFDHIDTDAQGPSDGNENEDKPPW